MKFFDKYKELDTDEKDMFFFMFCSIVLLGLLFSSYSNIWMSFPLFFVLLGYLFYILRLFGKRLETEKRKF